MRSVIIVLFLTLIPLNAPAAITDVTIHVDDAYKPYSYAEDGKPKGIYIEILRKVFSKMDGFRVKMVPVPWKRGKIIMEDGDGFGLAPVFFHGHDWQYLYPYSLPFYEEKVVVICNENLLKKRTFRWPDDFQGMRIGNIAGFDGWGGDKFRAMVKKGKFAYHEQKGSEKILQMIAMGRYDCILMETLAFDLEFERLKQEGVFGNMIEDNLVKAAEVGVDPVYIGYSETAVKKGKYPYAGKFQKSFDCVLYQMKKSGEIDKIVNDFIVK